MRYLQEVGVDCGADAFTKFRNLHVTLRILVVYLCTGAARIRFVIYLPETNKKIDYVALINLQRGVTPPYREVRIVFPKQ